MYYFPEMAIRQYKDRKFLKNSKDVKENRVDSTTIERKIMMHSLLQRIKTYLANSVNYIALLGIMGLLCLPAYGAMPDLPLAKQSGPEIGATLPQLPEVGAQDITAKDSYYDSAVYYADYAEDFYYYYVDSNQYYALAGYYLYMYYAYYYYYLYSGDADYYSIAEQYYEYYEYYYGLYNSALSEYYDAANYYASYAEDFYYYYVDYNQYYALAGYYLYMYYAYYYYYLYSGDADYYSIAQQCYEYYEYYIQFC